MSGPASSMKTGSSGLKSAFKALSVSFDDDHAMGNIRERIAARKKKKQLADEATKSLSSKLESKGKASKGTKKASADEEGMKLTKCLDRALHDCVGGMGGMCWSSKSRCLWRL